MTVMAKLFLEYLMAKLGASTLYIKKKKCIKGIILVPSKMFVVG